MSNFSYDDHFDRLVTDIFDCLNSIVKNYDNIQINFSTTSSASTPSGHLLTNSSIIGQGVKPSDRSN